MPDNDPLLDTAAVAAFFKVGAPTVRIYLKRTRARIAAGEPIREQDFPLPDETFGRSPVWKRSTIMTWLDNRPGSGRRPAG
ncbi:hypothetical protein [Streptacidiphilus sp. EB129]|uniref:hypothetical protein n=1 Tax=Streptacidiphilus sp. EB129 TaxID=3156262 RepID=UPI003511F771